jgi:hypothetical protein
LLTILICFLGCGKTSDVTNLETKYVSVCYVVDMNVPEQVVGLSSNVFIGYVKEMTDTCYISNFPYTRYDVKVIDNIKGELPLDTTVCVNKEGGISEDSSCYLLFENDFLPDEGNYYIFNVRERIEDGSYTASGINTVVLIDDIDISNSLNSKQELVNSDIYQRYIDAYQNQIVYDPNKG